MARGERCGAAQQAHFARYDKLACAGPGAQTVGGRRISGNDCNIVVASERAGRRVMASVTRFVERVLRLTVNARKSAVDRPWNRKFLGFTVSRTGIKLKVAETALDKLKARVRELARRTRGHRFSDIVAELREALLGWKAYFGAAEILSPLRDIDKWIRRKFRPPDIG